MKNLITTLALLTFSVFVAAEERVVVTFKDGSKQVMNESDISTHSYDVVSVERDIPVSTPRMRASNYRKGQDLPEGLSQRISLFSASSDNSGNSEYIPNDTFFESQIHWLAPSDKDLALNNILYSVQRLSPFRRPVVGIVDSGFYEHPDLHYSDGYSFATSRDGQIQRGEYFYIPPEYNGSPQERIQCSVHGTGVAGVAVAIRDNNFGIAGIADAELLAARSMHCGGGFMHDSADALLWQIGEPVDNVRPATVIADIVNLSLGSQIDYCPEFMNDAINKATEKGIPVVVANGNHQIDSSGFAPANCKNSISVAAASRDGDLFHNSNYGTTIDIAALGEDVASITEDPNSIGWWEMSSFATPIVTGVIANVISEHNFVDIDVLKFFLSVTATPFAAGQCDDSNRCGAGILDAGAFTQAVRDYKDNNIAVIRPALGSTALCDKALYMTDDNEKARLCSTLEIVLPEHQSNRSDIRFEILSFDKGADMKQDNGSLVLTSGSTRVLATTLDTEQFDYGLRMCNSERCFGNAPIKINDMSHNMPDVCLN